MSNINDVPMVMVLLSYGMELGIPTYRRTDGHVTTKIFEINGLPNFLRYGAPLARLRHARAPLLSHVKAPGSVTLLVRGVKLITSHLYQV